MTVGRMQSQLWQKGRPGRRRDDPRADLAQALRRRRRNAAKPASPSRIGAWLAGSGALSYSRFGPLPRTAAARSYPSTVEGPRSPSRRRRFPQPAAGILSEPAGRWATAGSAHSLFCLSARALPHMPRTLGSLQIQPVMSASFSCSDAPANPAKTALVIRGSPWRLRTVRPVSA